MKKLTILFILLLTVILTITAQPPQAFKYKAIARNKYGMLIINQTVAMRISLLQGSETGMPVYVESHTPASNLFGVIELEIGRGTAVSGSFESIDWGAADYYIKVEMDPKNKPVKNYTVIGTSQLLSVPYALYAGHVQNSDDNDADPLNELINNAYLSGTMLFIQEGGTTTLIDLSGLQDGTEDADADPENEIQDLQLVDNILTITKNGTATEIDLSVYLDDTDTHLTEAEVDAMVSNNGYLTSEVDGSIINEIQDISIEGHMLSISVGSTVQLPDSVNDADHDPFNELQVLSIGHDTIYLSDGGYVKLPALLGFSGDYNDLVNKPDVSTIPYVLIGQGAGKNTPSDVKIVAVGDSALYNNGIGMTSILEARYNTGLGSKALYSNTTGSDNTANGYNALFYNTTGSLNTAIGGQALFSNATGSSNTAIGVSSMFSNTTGYQNIAVGGGALANNTTGYYNTANGWGSLYSNTIGSYNTAVGRGALYYNTDGYNNTANGFGSLGHNTTGFENTANGYSALGFNTTGSYNTANGSQALSSNTIGNNNIALGYLALYTNGAGNMNVASGNRALFSNTNGSFNTAYGTQALRFNTDGSYNTALGYQALYSNTTGQFNTSTGRDALYSNTTGVENIANGNLSLYSNTSGSYNTVTGSYALYSNTTGNANTAVGNQALYYNTIGYHNNAFGWRALFSNTMGHNNTANGHGALVYNTTGINNTAIGNGALIYNITGDNNTALGYYAGPGSGFTDLANTSAFGYIAIVSASNTIRIGNTSITSIEGQVNFSATSDGRFKTNITNNVPGLNFITKLRPVTFQWDIHKLDAFMGIPDSVYEQSPKMEQARLDKEAKIYTGFVAQEVEEAAKACGFDFSGIVKPENEKSQYSLSYAEFVVPLVKALQEQQAIIEELKARIEVLEGK